MNNEDPIVVSASISRFLIIHLIIGISFGVVFGLITKSWVELSVIIFALFASAGFGYYVIDVDEKNIVIDPDKIEGPAKQTFFSKQRISISLADIDLSMSKDRPLWRGHSYISSKVGRKVILDKKFLSDNQVGQIINILNHKLTKRLRIDAK
jgi:hypothetical protein